MHTQVELGRSQFVRMHVMLAMAIFVCVCLGRPTQAVAAATIDQLGEVASESFPRVQCHIRLPNPGKPDSVGVHGIENKRPGQALESQSAAWSASANSPVSAAIVLVNNKHLTGEKGDSALEQSVNAIVNELGQKCDARVAVFALDRKSKKTKRVMDYTQPSGKFREAVGALEPAGRVPLHDLVAHAVQDVAQSKHANKQGAASAKVVFVLVADDDPKGDLKPEDVVKAAVPDAVAIYCLRVEAAKWFLSPKPVDPSKKLTRLSEATQGMVVDLAHRGETKSIDAAARKLVNAYVERELGRRLSVTWQDTRTGIAASDTRVYSIRVSRGEQVLRKTVQATLPARTKQAFERRAYESLITSDPAKAVEQILKADPKLHRLEMRELWRRATVALAGKQSAGGHYDDAVATMESIRKRLTSFNDAERETLGSIYGSWAAATSARSSDEWALVVQRYEQALKAHPRAKPLGEKLRQSQRMLAKALLSDGKFDQAHALIANDHSADAQAILLDAAKSYLSSKNPDAALASLWEQQGERAQQLRIAAYGQQSSKALSDLSENRDSIQALGTLRATAASLAEQRAEALKAKDKQAVDAADLALVGMGKRMISSNNAELAVDLLDGVDSLPVQYVIADAVTVLVAEALGETQAASLSDDARRKIKRLQAMRTTAITEHTRSLAEHVERALLTLGRQRLELGDVSTMRVLVSGLAGQAASDLRLEGRMRLAVAGVDAALPATTPQHAASMVTSHREVLAIQKEAGKLEHADVAREAQRQRARLEERMVALTTESPDPKVREVLSPVVAGFNATADLVTVARRAYEKRSYDQAYVTYWRVARMDPTKLRDQDLQQWSESSLRLGRLGNALALRWLWAERDPGRFTKQFVGELLEIAQAEGLGVELAAIVDAARRTDEPSVEVDRRLMRATILRPRPDIRCVLVYNDKGRVVDGVNQHQIDKEWQEPLRQWITQIWQLDPVQVTRLEVTEGALVPVLSARLGVLRVVVMPRFGADIQAAGQLDDMATMTNPDARSADRLLAWQRVIGPTRRSQLVNMANSIITSLSGTGDQQSLGRYTRHACWSHSELAYAQLAGAEGEALAQVKSHRLHTVPQNRQLASVSTSATFNQNAAGQRIRERVVNIPVPPDAATTYLRLAVFALRDRDTQNQDNPQDFAKEQFLPSFAD